MPKKTPEEIREKVVALRKAGATYRQIEANPETNNPDTGKPLSRPTLIKILIEAGLTRRANAGYDVKPQSTATTATATNGIDDFMPPNDKPKRMIEFQCTECGTEYVANEEDEVPETCPECGT